jgi:CBS domain-containing protein
MLVRNVMTCPALTVGAETSLKDALALLDEHSVTMLPVVSRTGEVVGVLSEADVVREALPADVRTHLIPEGTLQTERAHRVADLMSFHPVTVGPDTDLAAAAVLMTDTTVKSLPVVGDDGRVVGIVSRRDIVRLLTRSDEAISADLDNLFRLLGRDWLVDVVAGEVTVRGPEGESEIAMARSSAYSLAGVRTVIVE